MPKNYTYSDAGVNREQRHEAKSALQLLKETYKHSRIGPIIRLPYGNIFPQTANTYIDFVIEGVGTKVLLAQLAGKHDTIGIDAVAMAVNDVIRSGATPLAIADNIHTQTSSPELVKAWLKGIAEAADEAECPVVSGEIGDVAEILRGTREGTGFDMIIASIGQVAKEKIITGKNIKPGDPIIGMRSSGLHSNGITLARKILFKTWGGRYEPQTNIKGLDKQLVHEVLTPTKIYVRPLLRTAEQVCIKAAVHITGDAYLKFNNLSSFSPGIGFKFTNFDPQPIFSVIQETAQQMNLNITNEEMFRTFNMGWGFAIIVGVADAEKALATLEKTGCKPEIIGKITNTGKIEINYKSKKIVLA